MKLNILTLFLFLISCNTQSQDKLDLSKSNISHWEKDNETEWFRVQLIHPNMWGFIDKDSIVMIPFEYEFLNPFENGLAYAKQANKEFFITKNNLKLEGDYDKVDVFSHGLAAVRKNGKWRFINEIGKVVIPTIYDNVDYFRFSGLSSVSKNGKSGFINKLGEEIIPIIYEGAYQEMRDQNVLVEKNTKWAIFDNAGKQLTDFKYSSLENFKRAYNTDFSKDIFNRDESTFFENGAALVENNGKFEFINKNGQDAFSNNKFDSASVFDTYRNAIVKKSGKYGIIKTDGTFKVPLVYDFIDYYDTNHFNSEYYNARKGKIYYFFNKNLKKIGESFEPIYNDFSISNPTVTFKNLKGYYGIVDWEGNVVIPFEFDEINKIEKTDFLLIKKQNLYGIITTEGKVIIPPKYKTLDPLADKFDDDEFRNKHLFLADGKLINVNDGVLIGEYNSIIPIFYNHSKLLVSKNKKWGIIDVRNNILLPIEYDEISNWVEYGPRKKHFVLKNGKKGLLEYETFKTIIPPIYNQFIHRMGLIFASKDNKFGILDTNNKIICPFIYDDIMPSSLFGFGMKGENDEIFARKAKQYYQIDETGKILKEITRKEFDEKTK